jgi:hypothetical protein
VVHLRLCSSGCCWPSPLLVHPCRSPDWIFEISSTFAVFPFVLLRPTSTGPRELRSSSEFLFQGPGRWFPTLSLGIRPGCSFRRRHRCRSAGVQPDLFRPSIDLFPGVHSRADIAALASVTKCQLRDPVPTSPFRTVPPVFSADCSTCVELCAIAGAGFAGLLHPAADPGVRCVSCVFRVTLTPQTGHCWSTCSQAREDRFPAARFIPPEEFPPPAAVSRRRDRCPRGVCFPQSPNRLVASVAGFDARVLTP